MDNVISVSIVGGSGYAGGELLRILLFHPHVRVAQVTSRAFVGQEVGRAHPNLRKVSRLTFCRIDELLACDLLFVALPNKVSMGVMEKLRATAGRIIDLGADFRLKDTAQFRAWYRTDHPAPHLLSEFVYGIVELHRDAIRTARYVACGGCEASVSILTLYPLVKYHLIDPASIIIDAKMSSSQGGNTPTAASHHPERHGVVRIYKPVDHRHSVEIEQELSPYAPGIRVAVTATTIEMVRGLSVTIHARPAAGTTEKDVWKAYRAAYAEEPFIRIIKETEGSFRYPEPKILVGTNYCDIGFSLSTRENRLVAIGAIDNLGKGTSGQAVQAMNVMMGWKETAGLEFPGLHPI